MLSPSLSRLLAAAREEDLRRAAEARRREDAFARPRRSLGASWSWRGASWSSLRIRWKTPRPGRAAIGARARGPEAPPQFDGSTLTIRFAFPDDALALGRLATLDSRDQPPPGPLLVAEADGELRAALSLGDDSVIADPFHPTAGLVELLRTRADQLRSAARARDARRIVRPAGGHSDELQAGWGPSS
jgi:hypothetical protein